MHNEAGAGDGVNIISEKVPTYQISLAGRPNSCIVHVGKQKFRALVDTGAEVCLMQRRIYELLKNKPKLQRKTVCLNTVNGGPLKIDGCIRLPIDVGGCQLYQEFYVVRDIQRNVILGQDFLEQNGVRLYFDLGCMRVGKTYVRLERDLHISSVVRAQNVVVLKPQSARICYGRVRETPELPSGQQYQILATERGFIPKEPGISVVNAVGHLGKKRIVPILIVNNTNKTTRICRHSIVAQIEPLWDTTIQTVSSITSKPDVENTLDLNELQAPPAFKPKLQKLITRNADLFAKKDSELGHTNTVKMKVDTQNNAPIKLRPYRTPINNRKVIDEAVDEMLTADIVRRSRSPWSFPVVIVDKKDGSN